MRKNIISKIKPYGYVEFKFITDHYDVHLSGTCFFDNELYEFETIYPIPNDEMDLYVKLYKLNWYKLYIYPNLWHI